MATELPSVSTQNPYDLLQTEEQEQLPARVKRQNKKGQGEASANGNGQAAEAGSAKGRATTPGRARAASPQKGRNSSPLKGERGPNGEAWNVAASRISAKQARRVQRVVPVDDAIRDIEEQASSASAQNAVSRISIWRTWRRSMEENDPFVTYDDKGTKLAYTDVWIRSHALEGVLESVLQLPLAEDTELLFLFANCLEGDYQFYRKLAQGLRLLSTVFKEAKAEVPSTLIQNVCSTIAKLKVNPKMQKENAAQLKTLDAQIALQLQRVQDLSEQTGVKSVDEKNACTAALLQLGVTKQNILKSEQAPKQGSAELRPLLDQVNSDIMGLVRSAQADRDAARDKVRQFEQSKKAAMSSQDSSLTDVIAVKENLEQEEESLRTKKAELEAQIEGLKVEIQKVQRKKREHTSEYSKVIGVYQKWLDSFQGEDDSVRNGFKAAEANMAKAEAARDFVRDLAQDAQDILSGHSARTEEAKHEASRQFMSFLDTHLGSLSTTMELVARRVKFCNTKLASMKAERQEAVELGMTDVATDLSKGLAKFEAMQKEAAASMGKTAADVESISEIVSGFDSENNVLKKKAQNVLKEIQRLKAEAEAN